MPVSNRSIISRFNSASTSNCADELYTANKIAEGVAAGNVVSVACLCDLPEFTENIGRMYFVEETCGYRYSNGFEWSNVFSSECTVSYKSLYMTGNDREAGVLGINTANSTLSSPVEEASQSRNWCYIGIKQGGALFGNGHSSAIKTDGTLWAWGCNSNCQLGTGDNISHSSPVQELTSATDWYVSQLSRWSTHALKTDGTLWGWGQGSWGVLGNNSTSRRNSPVQEITSATDWCCLTTSLCSAYGLKTNNTIWVWGYNNEGQLGTNNRICYSSPVQEVTSATNWCQFNGGRSALSALKTDGTIWSWGCDRYGSFLIHETNIVCISSPVQELTSATDWCYVDRGVDQIFALKTDGTLWSGGRGSYMPNCTSVCYSSPIQEMTSATDWAVIAAGDFNGYSIKTNGTLWNWGTGSLFSNTSSCCTPVQEITSSCDWVFVAGGYTKAGGIRNVAKGFNQP